MAGRRCGPVLGGGRLGNRGPGRASRRLRARPRSEADAARGGLGCPWRSAPAAQALAARCGAGAWGGPDASRRRPRALRRGRQLSGWLTEAVTAHDVPPWLPAPAGLGGQGSAPRSLARGSSPWSPTEARWPAGADPWGDEAARRGAGTRGDASKPYRTARDRPLNVRFRARMDRVPGGANAASRRAADGRLVIGGARRGSGRAPTGRAAGRGRLLGRKAAIARGDTSSPPRPRTPSVGRPGARRQEGRSRRRDPRDGRWRGAGDRL